MNPAPPSSGLSEADVEAIRACGQVERNIGYVACLVGVLTMFAGKFMAGAPTFLVAVGVGVVILGWGLLAHAVIKRVTLARILSARASG